VDITWLHVSDFHFRAGDAYDRDVVLRALVQSVARFRERGRVPDLIFATGDVAYSGNAAEYELATTFFDDLLVAAGLDRRQLYVVPGNHDIDRDGGTWLKRTLESREEADAYFRPGAPLIHLQLKQHAFRDWYNRYFDGIRSLPEDSSCGPVEAVEVNGIRLGILPLNVTLFCQGDDDHEKLWLGRRCLDTALQQLHALDTHCNVALMHHPLDWLHAIERGNIKATLQRHVDFLLRGHLHETEIEALVTAQGGTLSLAAGAAYQTRKWPNRAYYCHRDGQELTVFPIRYEDQPEEVWTVDPSLFPHELQYQRRFPLPKASTSLVPESEAQAGTDVKRSSSPERILVEIKVGYLACHIDNPTHTHLVRLRRS
jgi:predicted phosphodiesterase